MSTLLCCCSCFSSENSDETESLVQTRGSNQKGAASARQTPSAQRDAKSVKQNGRLRMKRVCVSEMDQRFSDMAETFNQQQERHEAMVRHIKNVRQLYSCNDSDSLALAECVGKIREEHEAKYRVFLKLSGYDFSLNVVPLGSAGGNKEQPFPPHLKLAQDEFKGASESAKATISKSTTLQELIGWLLRSRDQMAEQVKGAAGNHQELGRLNKNLEENMMEVRTAKGLS